MGRLNEEVKKQIINQIREGKSINKICNSLGLGKSTVYYYYKIVKGKKYAKPLFRANSSEIEGEIIGIFTGDGSQYFEPKKYHYEVNVHFGGHNYWYALHVKNLFETFFNKKFRLQKETLNRYRLRTRSKEIYNYFKNYIDFDSHIKHVTVKLLSLNHPINFKLGFLRGLVDTDGHVSFNRKGKRDRIFYYTTSKALANQVSSMLTEMSIKHGLHVHVSEKYKPLYYINIWKESVNSFINIVKPLKAQTGWAGS